VKGEEEIEEGGYRGTFRTVSDPEHSEIIRLYIEEDLSYEKIAEQINRSSRTPHLHIQRHNREVKKTGFCLVCKRMNTKYFSEIIEKNKNIHYIRAYLKSNKST
jgi:predicted DNA-binding protein YlxM (UPF0122 family)